MKKPKGWRTITIEDEEWIWKVGRGNISIRDPDRKHYYVDFSTLTGIEDTERAAWKGYLHIKPSHVRNYIDVHLRPREATGINLTPYLKDIFHEKKPAQYVGGTLSFPIGENVVMANIGEGYTEEEKCWIALNYIKYKGPDRRFYQLALDIVMGKPEYKKYLAKALIKSSNEWYN